MTPRRSRAGVLKVIAGGVALAAALALAGCGDAAAPDRSAQSAADPSAESSVGPSEEASSPEASEPSLPPGDPGLDAPSVPDPGLPSAETPEKPVRNVPVAALLDEQTVSAAAGGSWTRGPGGGETCTLPPGSLGSRSMSYLTPGAALVQTVATFPDAPSADRGVNALNQQLAGCGWSVQPDPRLGSASVAAVDAERTLTAVSAEGVAVVMVGRGAFTGDAGAWASLVDLANGSACPAAPDGCH